LVRGSGEPECGLLPTRHDRSRRRAAEQRDELAALHHSITSSARTINVIGTWSPIALRP